MHADPDAWLSAQEDAAGRVRPAARKRILWADPDRRARTPLSLVYVHGFSASAAETRPLPDQLAQALGANLHFTRLTGHGIDGAAMGRASLPAWRADVAEALAVGRAIGERVLVMATSTGATLATLALTQARTRADVAGAVFLAPNFAIRARGAALLGLPGARWFVPRVIGPSRGGAPLNPGHAEGWITEYPTTALAPLGAAVAAARRAPVQRIGVPALFVLSDQDQVVRADRSRLVAARWGGGAEVLAVTPGPGDDPAGHVIAGDVFSPGLTEKVREGILDWIARRGIAAP
ncbi:alpha/beta hydrolase [Halovulum dunhuangense]|nr:alpha/beta fold hydrolase [Halovulum dunhuangense]